MDLNNLYDRYRLTLECSQVLDGSFEIVSSKKQPIKCDYLDTKGELTATEILTLLYNRMYDYLEENEGSKV